MITTEYASTTSTSAAAAAANASIIDNSCSCPIVPTRYSRRIVKLEGMNSFSSYTIIMFLLAKILSSICYSISLYPFFACRRNYKSYAIQVKNVPFFVKFNFLSLTCTYYAHVVVLVVNQSYLSLDFMMMVIARQWQIFSRYYFMINTGWFVGTSYQVLYQVLEYQIVLVVQILANVYTNKSLKFTHSSNFQ